MRKFQDQPLARKALTLGIAPTVCAVVLSGVASMVATNIRARTNTTADLDVQAAIVAENVAAALITGDHGATQATLQTLRGRTNVDAACVYDADGRIFEAYSTAAASCPERVDSGASTARSPFALERAVNAGGRSIGTVRILGNRSAFYGWLRTQMVVLALSLAGGLAIAFALTWRLQRSISSPVLALARTADTVSTTRDYSQRVPRTTDDEVGDLADSFNTMLDEIQHRDDALMVEIAERKRAEQLKDSFLAAVSHELRTPLNAILGWLQLIRDKRPDADRLDRALESLERNARSQARLIEDLLDISRMSTGKLQISVVPLDLRQTVSAAVDIITPAVGAKSIELTASLPAVPCPVLGDADRLQQLLLNVLTNAVKFTPNRGAIRVAIDARHDDQNYAVSIRDSGVGIEPAFLPFVFDRFRQADSSMTRKHDGLGLGLAIARELAALHGGSIAATSEGAGRGATFTITLPELVGVELPASVMRMRPRTQPAALRDRRILVVDDDPDGLDLASIALSRSGAIVTTARSGTDALDLWRRAQFDALVCDLAMPAIDGFEVLQSIQEHDREAGRSTRALALTAHASPDFRTRVLAAGFHQHIVKPYEQTALIAAVAGLFSGPGLAPGGRALPLAKQAGQL